jgi:hypothetical protein
MHSCQGEFILASRRIVKCSVQNPRYKTCDYLLSQCYKSAIKTVLYDGKMVSQK